MAREDGGDKKEATTGHHDDLFHPVPRSLLLRRGGCAHLVVTSIQEEGVGAYFDVVTSVFLVRVVQDGTIVVVVAVVDVVRNVHD